MQKKIMDNEHNQKRPEIDMQEVLRESFESGEGVVSLLHNISDAALLLVIKQAASFGKPFTVIPCAKIVYVGPPDNGPELFSKEALAESTTSDGHFSLSRSGISGRAS